jgi:hypothetical protein
MATKEMIRGAEMAWSSEQRWPWAEMEMVACLNRDGEEEGAEIDDGLVKENPTTGTEIRGAVMPMRKRIRGAEIIAAGLELIIEMATKRIRGLEQR